MKAPPGGRTAPVKRRGKRNGGDRDLNDVPLREVFEWALGDGTLERPPGYPRIAIHLDDLMNDAWKTRKVGDATRDNCDAHMAKRCATISKLTKRPIKPRSARTEIDTFLAMIRAFAKANLIKDTLSTRYEKISAEPVDRTLSREEIVQLLRACWGSRWDGTSMRRIPEPGRRRFVRHHRDRMARYVLLALMLGTADGLMRRLRWKPAENGEPPHSWVDLDKRALHRLGEDAPKLEKYYGVPVRIPHWLIRHMRRWRQHDLALGVPLVLGTARSDVKLFNMFQTVRADAGLDDEVTVGTLIDTFAANAMRRPGRRCSASPSRWGTTSDRSS